MATPRILNLPRRRRNPPTKNASGKSNSGGDPFLRRVAKGGLDRLYGFPAMVVYDRRNRGMRGKEEEDGDSVEEREREENWRFQVEMLRAECNFLRMEKDVVVNKLERDKDLLEKSLKFSVHAIAILSGKKKIQEGKNVNLVLEEECERLAKKLMELHRKSSKVNDPKLRNCSNLDKQASLLRKQLEKLGVMADETCVKDIQVVSGTSLANQSTRNGRIHGRASSRRTYRFADVETLRKNMERLSKGKLKRMEEAYEAMLSTVADCSVPSSTPTSRQYDLPDLSSFTLQHSSKNLQDAMSGEPKPCSGHCRAIVQRIVEQARAETEQWSQMQEMLCKVRDEMEQLQASRDFWEQLALQSDHKIQNLKSEVEEWKQKVLLLETKEIQLERSRIEKSHEPEVTVSKDLASLSLGAQIAKEKRRLIQCVKGTEKRDKMVVDYGNAKKAVLKNGGGLVDSNRHPFKDISNLSPMMKP